MIEPDSFHTCASGGLGHGLPAAVGVALARPDCKVVGLLGDGSAMYAIQGLAAAAELALPIAFIIVNNGSYEALVEFGKLFGLAQLPGTRLPQLDFCALAQGHGSPEGMGALSIAVMRAQFACQHLRRAGVAGGRRAPGRVYAGQHQRAQGGVTVETAAGEDDAAFDTHAATLAVLRQRDGLHAARTPVDLLDRGVQRQRDMAALGQRVQQPRHQRIAHDQPRAARVAQSVGSVAQQQFDRVSERSQ